MQNVLRYPISTFVETKIYKMPEGDENFKILKQYVEEVIMPHFKIDFADSGYTQIVGSPNFKGTIDLPPSFVSYKNTDCYYKGDSQKFLQVTSLKTCFQIINTEHFLVW